MPSRMGQSLPARGSVSFIRANLLAHPDRTHTVQSMPTARYHCPEFADAIERLVEDESTSPEGSHHDGKFQFVRADEGPETVEIAVDSPIHDIEVTLQTVSTLQAHEQIQQDDRSSAEAGSGGSWSTGPLPSRHGVDSPDQVEPDSTGTSGRRAA